MAGSNCCGSELLRIQRPNGSPNQLTEACGWEQISRYLIRDRDGAYGEIFIRRVRSIGIRDRPTSPRSPWQNAYAERLIGSIRRECLDHIVVFGERHLHHVLLCYMDYYNGTRTQLSLNKDAPISRAAEAAGARSVPSDPGWTASPICSGLICGRHNRPIFGRSGRTRIETVTCAREYRRPCRGCASALRGRSARQSERGCDPRRRDR